MSDAQLMRRFVLQHPWPTEGSLCERFTSTSVGAFSASLEEAMTRGRSDERGASTPKYRMV